MEKFNKYVMPTYGRYDVEMKSGENCLATDENEKKYIDFGSGIGVNSLGYCDGDWVNAVCEQAKTLNHTSNYYYTKIQGNLAEKLCTLTGYSKLFFGNSGAEANECAIKLARKYSFDKYGKNRHTILTLKNSFHGRTMATISATGQDNFHNYFFPFLEGFTNTIANDLAHFKTRIDSTICAVMIELIQGEGGVVVLDKEYVKEVAKICEEKDILLIVDEVQTGVGRTGTFLTSEQYNILPDITTLAKGIAGGLPMGVCLANEKCQDVLNGGTHGSTFGGNPICCAAANVVLDKISENLKSVTEKGNYFKEKLMSLSEVGNVSGLGLMLGIQLKTKTAKDTAKACLDKGLLVLTAKDKLRLLPPLNITYPEIDSGLQILASVLA